MLFFVFLVLSWFSCIHCNLTAQELALVQQFVNTSACRMRHEYMHWLDHRLSCKEVFNLNPTCRRNLTALYFESPPLVMTFDDGQVGGIIPVYLHETYIHHCCQSCNMVTFTKTNDTNLFKNVLPNQQKYDLILPVEASVESKKILGQPYLNLLQISEVMVIGKSTFSNSFGLTNNMIIVVLRSWPLLLVALIMCFCAGLIMWLIDTWSNKKDFPRRFPRGAFEGFWWAYISMTTVGYGDRTPVSTCGRFFAILWIFLGIVIFNMFTANLTSNMTAILTGAEHVDWFNQKIGVMNGSTASKEGVYKLFASPVEYNKVEDLLVAHKNKDIAGFALTGKTWNFYKATILDTDPELKVISTEKLDYSSIGLIVQNMSLWTQMSTFMDANKDTQKIFLGKTMHVLHEDERIQHKHSRRKAVSLDYESVLKQNPFSAEQFQFALVMAVIVGITVVFLVLGLILSLIHKGHETHRKKSQLRKESKLKRKLTETSLAGSLKDNM